MDRIISEQKVFEVLDIWYYGLEELNMNKLKAQIKAILSADMFSDLKAEISMYENSEQSIDEMIQGIKSIISIYER